jgi:cell division protein FtsI (penicillin-binding protein 3)
MYDQEQDNYKWRLLILVLLMFFAVLGLLGRIVYLGIIKHGFLLDQSNMRSIREVNIPAHRGMITDRNGKPLAISIPAASIWVNPKLFSATTEQMEQLALLLNLPSSALQKKITAQKQHGFVYLKRSLPQEVAAKILSLHIPGISKERGYKRYYPEADAVAQLVGFTNIDDRGQEGLELAYDSWLRGVAGKIRVVKDCMGNTIANLGVISEPQQGKDLALSVDRRVQYLAYQELKKTIEKYQAEYGSVVVLKVKTGEVLAMANFPSYNPNNRLGIFPGRFRNRAATDLFEPGSTIKALTIMNALNSGKYKPNSLVDTNPGVLEVDGHLIRDDGRINNGLLTVTGVLKKSSDIGMAKMTLSLPSNSLLSLLRSVGFGQSTQSGFPGEGAGVLPNHLKWRPFVLATLSFGYSISVSLLQLAQAYAVIASYGLLRPITFVKSDELMPGKQVLSQRVCRQILAMLETVLDIGGTGKRAQIPGYRVAGKTGTAHIAKIGGYYTDRYFATFVGIAPVTDPQLVIAVVVKNPRGSHYHGGSVAAPVFASIMNGTLRILGVPPDDKESI